MFRKEQTTLENSRTLLARFRSLAVALAVTAVAVGGVSAGVVWAQGRAGAVLREPRPQETIVLDLPAGESCAIEGRTLTANAGTREFFTTDPAVIRWGKGFRLSVRNAKVTLVSGPRQADGQDGTHRILIEPQPGTPAAN